MKLKNPTKKIIAAVGATALAAPLAVLADGHSERAQVYGFVNLSVDYEGYKAADNLVDDEGNPREVEDGNLAMNTGSSHFGLRGSEDLGGGLSAVYQAELEWTYTGDVQGSGGGGQFITQVRDSYVGLDGEFGRLTLGRQVLGNQFVYDGPGRDWIAQVGTSGGALSMGWWGENDDGDVVWNGWGSRANNMIRYTAPSSGALNLVFSFVPGHFGVADEHTVGARAAYAEGPLSFGATLWHHMGDDAISLFSLGGRYDFGAVTLGAQFSAQSHDADDFDNDHSAVALGAMMPLGNTGRVKGIVTQHMDDGDDLDYTTIAAGYDHIFSSRTELRFAVAATLNDENRNVTPHAYGIYGPSSIERGDIAADETHMTVSANLRHSF
ncbi:hypothetical protein CKO15_09630 [Halorhodospira abdelmalekii]|uniref:porin n=1 Tax=Halorhodospira abdelmalekii TaxID=421629 RepID=UPI001906816B|nr:porin [Halorhodospira abdelmalekii]MBK1735538.1 hypothetical protein [Halorhodospira abdelmalekii]